MEEIIEKIQKLLQLGESSNRAESELAIKKAHELMLEYQLTAKDIDRGFIAESEIVIPRNAKMYKKSLLFELAECNGCVLVSKYKSGIVCVGRKVNLNVTILMYDFVIGYLNTELQKVPKKLKDDFCLGYVYGIKTRLRESQISWANSDPANKDIVVVNQQDANDINDFLKREGVSFKARNIDITIEPTDGARAGFKKSKDLNLERQISCNIKPKQIERQHGQMDLFL